MRMTCLLQTWRRPTLPRLETKYHRRWGVSRPCSEWERVQPPRQNHQVGKGQVFQRSWRALALFSWNTSVGLFALTHRFREGLALARTRSRAGRGARLPQGPGPSVSFSLSTSRGSKGQGFGGECLRKANGRRASWRAPTQRRAKLGTSASANRLKCFALQMIIDQ